MNTGGGNSQLMSEINVTPLVDVMLVLLIIFMVTAPMMVQGVNVDLPETTSGPLPADKEPLTVTVEADGKISIIKQTIDISDFQMKLKAVLKTRPGETVYLRADKTVAYGLVARVMAEIKEAGVARVGLVTEPLDTPGKAGKGA